MKITSQSDTSLTITQDNMINVIAGVIFIIIGIFGTRLFFPAAIFALCGIYIVYSRRSISFEVHQEEHLARLHIQSLTSKKLFDYALQDFSQVKILVYHYRQSGKVMDTPWDTKTEIILMLKDGSSINLSSGAATITGFRAKNIQKAEAVIGQTIAQFLQIPCETVGPISSVDRKKLHLTNVLNPPTNISPPQSAATPE